MSLHESDLDIEVKFAKLKEREQILDKELLVIREYQTNLNSLRMVASYILLDITVNDKITQQKVTKYSLPNDYTGNKMTKETRISQKISLIKNIDEFLGVKHV